MQEKGRVTIDCWFLAPCCQALPRPVVRLDVMVEPVAKEAACLMPGNQRQQDKEAAVPAPVLWAHPVDLTASSELSQALSLWQSCWSHKKLLQVLYQHWRERLCVVGGACLWSQCCGAEGGRSLRLYGDNLEKEIWHAPGLEGLVWHGRVGMAKQPSAYPDRPGRRANDKKCTENISPSSCSIVLHKTSQNEATIWRPSLGSPPSSGRSLGRPVEVSR